jgi:hypothetical protein
MTVLNYIPDGWAMTVGEGDWNDAASWDFAKPIAADGSFRFISNYGHDVHIEADPAIDDNRIAVQAGTPILISDTVIADSNAPGANVSLSVIWEDSAKAVLSESSVFLSHVTTANALERKSGVVTAPAGSCFYRLKFGKVDGAFQCWWNDAHDSVFPVMFDAYRSSSNYNIANSSWTILPLNGEYFDYGDNYDTSTFAWTCPGTGVYSLFVRFQATKSGGFSTTNPVELAIYINGLVDTVVDLDYPAVGQSEVMLKASQHMLISGGDTVSIYAHHTDGGNISMLNGKRTRFSIAEIH